jgi:hypothetical protein
MCARLIRALYGCLASCLCLAVACVCDSAFFFRLFDGGKAEEKHHRQVRAAVVSPSVRGLGVVCVFCLHPHTLSVACVSVERRPIVVCRGRDVSRP